MPASRRTQPLRKGPGRVPGGGLAAALKGRTAGGFNPQDARRRAKAGGTGGARAPGTMPRRRSPRTMPNQTSGSGNTRLVEAIKKRAKPLDMASPEMSVSRAQRKARKVELGERKATHKTTAGKRRLSFKEAYLRKTTDSSRARTEARYGKTAGAKLQRQATGPTLRRTPVPPGATGSKPPLAGERRRRRGR